VRVPLDWAHPYGATINLAVARRPARSPRTRLGALLFNPGGPGGSGVDVVTNVPDVFSPDLRDRYDIVGFDPRGVNGSYAVTCDSDLLQRPRPDVPGTPAELDAVTTFNHDLGVDCASLTGPLAGHVDAVSVARDMDAIRAALGEQKLTYYGVSYATLMGQEYAELFPTHVGRMVLDSNVDHSQRTARGFLVSSSAAVEDSFDEFARWCARSTECDLHGRDVGAVFDGLYRRAAQGSLHWPDLADAPIAPVELVSLAFGYFYDPAWQALAYLLSVLDSAAPPKPTALARRAYGEPAAVPFQPIFCADWRLPVRSFGDLTGLRRAATAAAPHLRLSPLGWTATLACPGWPQPVVNPQHRLAVHGAPGILMLNGRHDPATPYAWAVAVHGQLPGSVLLTYDGWGHGTYWKSRCVSDAADRYLLTGGLPPAGTRCPGVEPQATPAGAPVGPTRPVVPGWR
jgi:pimeloyl-ACP methyl ester carboxylesterase